MSSNNSPTRVLVAGSDGMVGSAVCRALERANIEYVPGTRKDADFCIQSQVDNFVAKANCDSVIIAAAKVGGIHANDSYPADFIYENLMIESNLISSSHRQGINRLIFLGSSCIYPREARQPILESELLNGPLEPTNDAYAIAKIAGIKLCESFNRQHDTDYRSLMPTNLYGPGDNFHSQNSHVIPGLLRRFHAAKVSGASEVTVWGSGKPRREFLHVNDLANAVVHVLTMDKSVYWQGRDSRCSHLNLGTGEDIEIAEVAELIRDVVGLDAQLHFDLSRPDGTPRKLLDVSQANRLGWKAEITLQQGLKETYAWFLRNEDGSRQ